MDQSNSAEHQSQSTTQNGLPADLRILQSKALFDDEKEIGIAHGGSIYRLKITRQGKLILNK
ncbi:MAG: hemin uptake protein HemP [Pseudomonadota bacterium]